MLLVLQLRALLLLALLLLALLLQGWLLLLLDLGGRLLLERSLPLRRSWLGLRGLRGLLQRVDLGQRQEQRERRHRQRVGRLLLLRCEEVLVEVEMREEGVGAWTDLCIWSLRARGEEEGEALHLGWGASSSRLYLSRIEIMMSFF